VLSHHLPPSLDIFLVTLSGAMLLFVVVVDQGEEGIQAFLVVPIVVRAINVRLTSPVSDSLTNHRESAA
jgi:hypothetical protein